MNEFDFKDIPQDFRYSSKHEHQFTYNISNGFKLNQAKKDSGIESKLERPKEMLGMNHHSYTITPEGVQLHKGEELGMFEMGSTIALLFECPKDYRIVPKEGEKVLLGQPLLIKS